MNREPMITQLSNFSKYFSEDITISMTMSEIYHDFALENYNLYRKYRSDLHSIFDEFMNHINTVLSSVLLELDPIELREQFLPYTEFLEKDMNEFEAFLNYPIETVDMTKDFFSYISKFDKVKNNEKFKVSALNESFVYSLKHGIAAISFEAFACEALINETLLCFISKNQLDKKHKSKSYKSKLENISEILNIEEDYSDVITSLEELMKSRNDIAHFKGIKYNLFNLVDTHMHNEEHQDELFYYGETFKILDANLTAYDKLNRFINKNSK